MRKLFLPVLLASTFLVGCAGTELMELDGNRYFKVLQVLENGSMLANRCTSVVGSSCYGDVVLLDKSVDEMPYDEKIIHLQNPQIIKTYSYTTVKDVRKTVPVIIDKK